MGGEAEKLFSFQEACAALNISPRTFRSVLEEFSGILSAGDGNGGPQGELAAKDLEILKRIIGLRGEGLSNEAIIDRLQRERGRMQGEAVNPTDRLLLEKLDLLAEELMKSEERRIEDRDRLLTALLRTQLQIQHLRSELAGSRSRRDRKGRGLLERLLGR